MAVEKDGVPASGWAYVPDPEKTSTWKLNISDATHVSGAVAALGKGFRGNKVEIPEEDLPAVKRKVKAAYKKFHPDLDMPEVLKAADLAEAFSLFLEKYFGGSSKEQEPEMEVTKSLDEEEKMALFVVLEPEVEDLHGDIYSEKEVEKACISYNQHCRKANLYHRIETEDFSIVQSFVTPVGFTDDTGREIKKGTWLAWTKFENDNLWGQVKSGEFQGLSIGCKATFQEL